MTSQLYFITKLIYIIAFDKRRTTKFLSWSMNSAQTMYKRQLRKREDQNV